MSDMLISAVIHSFIIFVVTYGETDIYIDYVDPRNFLIGYINNNV